MSKLQTPTPGLPVGSYLYHKDKFNKSELYDHWCGKFGESFVFEHSYFPMKDYYSKEMGEADQLSRFFVVSRQLVQRQELVDFKLWADEYEGKHSLEQKRQVNLDVGLLSIENFGLATGKNFRHRVYLDKGVFFDLTLFYENGGFVTLPWSYPDYSHPEVVQFFDWCRQFLFQKIQLA